ncbi:hypothetical protein Misp02_43890 [Microtetraspora sp. NBRC 16547]|nr:hypothetical protein Misp02_43890 [Microtetraspora sp. NBRC 16547]
MGRVPARTAGTRCPSQEAVSTVFLGSELLMPRVRAETGNVTGSEAH